MRDRGRRFGLDYYCQTVAYWHERWSSGANAQRQLLRVVFKGACYPSSAVPNCTRCTKLVGLNALGILGRVARVLKRTGFLPVFDRLGLDSIRVLGHGLWC